MRKLIIFVAIMFALLLAAKDDLYAFNRKFNGEYAIYTTEVSGEPLFSAGGMTVYKSGDITLLDGKKVEGESITLESDENEVDTLLKKLYVVYHRTERVGDTLVVYGYSPKLKRTVFVRGAPLNVMITVAGNVTVISNPVNSESF